MSGYQARKEQPYLARFENDWATSQILMQYLSNRRKNALKKGFVVAEIDQFGRRILKDVRNLGNVNTIEEELDDGYVDSFGCGEDGDEDGEEDEEDEEEGEDEEGEDGDEGEGEGEEDEDEDEGETKRGVAGHVSDEGEQDAVTLFSHPMDVDEDDEDEAVDSGYVPAPGTRASLRLRSKV